jgi:hypothetical protein
MGMGYFFTDRQVLAAAAKEIVQADCPRRPDGTDISTYPLCDAAQAHWDLEGRQTMGSVILIP